MAIAPTSTRPIESEATEPPPAKAPSPWRWMVAACLLLATSGIIRIAQERRFGLADQDTATPPFPLRELPKTFGDWTMQGPEQVLDEETLQIAGSTGYIARAYADERTGVLLQVLVVFGPAERVFPHSPIVCFPSFGYTLAAGAMSHTIPKDGGATFESRVYVRPGDPKDRKEVYCSFWHDGRWSPQASGSTKQFRHRPKMFKIQVERIVTPTERRRSTEDGLSPIEDFLGHLVPEIDRRIAETIGADGGAMTKAEGGADQPTADPAP